GLAGTNFARVAPGRAGEILHAVNFEHGDVGERIGADEFRFQHAAIAGGDADVDRAVDDVIVGDDVPVGRDDHATAHAVLDLRLLASGAEELKLTLAVAEALAVAVAIA